MPMKARFEEVDAVTVDEAGQGPNRQFKVPVVSPSRVDRATGTLRSPEATVDLPPSVLTVVIAAAKIDLPSTVPVVGLVVHVVSRRATAVGVFRSAAEATVWWAQPFNRLAHNRDVVFCLVEVEQMF